MRKVIVAVRDSKSELFGIPHFETSVGTAIRSFEEAVNSEDKNNILFTHPQDFTLWELGSFEDSDGTLSMPQPGGVPRILCQALEVKTKVPVKDSKVSKV